MRRRARCLLFWRSQGRGNMRDEGTSRQADLAARLFAGRGAGRAHSRSGLGHTRWVGPSLAAEPRTPSAFEWGRGIHRSVVGAERWMFTTRVSPMPAQPTPQFLGASGQACWEEIWGSHRHDAGQVLRRPEPTWWKTCLLMCATVSRGSTSPYYRPIETIGQPVGSQAAPKPRHAG